MLLPNMINNERWWEGFSHCRTCLAATLDLTVKWFPDNITRLIAVGNIVYGITLRLTVSTLVRIEVYICGWSRLLLDKIDSFCTKLFYIHIKFAYIYLGCVLFLIEQSVEGTHNQDEMRVCSVCYSRVWCACRLYCCCCWPTFYLPIWAVIANIMTV